jgi:ribonuclease HI
MIYSVVPEEMAPELYDRLVEYYKDDPNVKVIIDRRKSERRARGEEHGGEHREVRDRVKVVVHVDGGARGNPGPAAAAAVLTTPEGEVVDEAHELLGVVTNNVAEYRGLLLGLARARELGADDVEVVNDSELVAKQINGVYKVKHPDMRPLHRQAMEALKGFRRWRVRSVPRAQNANADALVNQALDAAR